MALCGCPSSLVGVALVALLVLPAQYYYVPELAEPPRWRGATFASPTPLAALDDDISRLPPLELFAAGLLVLLATTTYLIEWIQRKIMEKRLIKVSGIASLRQQMNQHLAASVERLRARDAEQEQLEATLKLVQNATSEYNLLLYLLLRQHRCVPTNCPPSNCFFDKGLDDELAF